MKRQLPCQSGQTLLELIVAIGVVTVVITALVSAVTASLRHSEFTATRSRGVRFVQEGIELTRKLRDTNTWTTFQNYSLGNGSWCLDAGGVWTVDGGSGTCPLSAGNTFWRSVHFVWNDPIMDVTVQVSWGERTLSSAIEMKTYFTQWK